MILESMKIFQELKGIRIRKIEEKNKLRKQIRAISSTMSRIKSELPVINIPEEAVSPKLPIKETPPVEQPKKEAISLFQASDKKRSTKYSLLFKAIDDDTGKVCE